MPKQKITKEMVVDAAFEIARSDGLEQVMVKNIAEKLNCSVQPIYSYCTNMDGLRQDVVERTNAFIQKYVAEHVDKTDMFRSMGHTFVRLAGEEPHIFKMFILQQRNNVSSLDDLYKTSTDPHVAGFIAKSLNISVEKARQLHLNMLIYTIGIGTIFCMTKPGISTDEIFAHQEIAYDAFLKNALEERDAEKE